MTLYVEEVLALERTPHNAALRAVGVLEQLHSPYLV